MPNRVKSIAERNQQRKKNYEQTLQAPLKGKPWSLEDRVAVLTMEETDRSLSKRIGRSVQAIQRKRHELRYGK